MTLKGFSPSEDEMNLANQILLKSDCQQSGALNSDAAINIFEKSGLSYPILRDIWSIADENASGDLTIRELAAAIRLMGWVQAGEALEKSLLFEESGPLPTIDGLADVVRKRSVSPLTRYPPINQDDIRRFKRDFNSAGPLDGFLNRDDVLELFMRESLSNGDLFKIRKLVDVTERGALNFREFAMGMYLIQAIQSCLIASVPSTVPPELHDLFSGPALFDLHPTPKRPSHSHRSSSSLQSSPTQSQILPVPPTAVHNPHADESWDVSPIERFEANKHFQKLDYDHNGYIEEKQAVNFMLNYNLSSEDLARIWSLVNLNGDNRLTKDGFAVAIHLINCRVAGDEIPTSLPPSLVPPSMRSKGTHSSSPPSPLSPKQLAKFKSPPPPPPMRIPSRTKRAHSLLAINSTTPDSTPRLNVPTSPLPPNSIKSPKVQSNFPTPPLSPSNPAEADLTSPFEDPVNDTSPSRHHSKRASKLLPSNHSNNEALEEYKKEISRLTLQVNSLLSQLTTQNNLKDDNKSLKDDNETLRNERDSLKADMQGMGRTLSEVLSASEASEEQYNQDINRLSTELASKEAEHESTQRMLAVLTGDEVDLRQQLRESQAATAKAENENQDLRQIVASREGDITELRARLSDMEKEIAEGPESTSSNRELRVLQRDVTRENDRLKKKIRDMEASMEQLLLSTKSHKFDEMERENRRLQAHVQQLEMLATQLQSSPSNSTQRYHNQALDEAARENEQLKVQLLTGHRAFADFQSKSETTIDELQRKFATMEHENNQLKMEVASSSQEGRADNSVPPPAYNDSFSLSP